MFRTRTRNIKDLEIITMENKALHWERGEKKEWFSIGNLSISLYEYKDYWKITSFMIGLSGVNIEIFPKNIIKKIEYRI